ncbi:hypothetical protein EVAR_13042_1 [Eumeta japonica]|uniref:Uncharacterized protein n=1 Tax=Eumeta variegata TaxID=151549 RepID=A0A4C1VI06_EUMVA|nr:hypothetical protein EVAR_13042_1 [Eumeta japonica]
MCEQTSPQADYMYFAHARTKEDKKARADVDLYSYIEKQFVGVKQTIKRTQQSPCPRRSQLERPGHLGRDVRWMSSRSDGLFLRIVSARAFFDKRDHGLKITAATLDDSRPEHEAVLAKVDADFFRILELADTVKLAFDDLGRGTYSVAEFELGKFRRPKVRQQPSSAANLRPAREDSGMSGNRALIRVELEQSHHLPLPFRHLEVLSSQPGVQSVQGTRAFYKPAEVRLCLNVVRVVDGDHNRHLHAAFYLSLNVVVQKT